MHGWIIQKQFVKFMAEPAEHHAFAWILNGRRGHGKSSFGAWCDGIVKDDAANLGNAIGADAAANLKDVIVCSINAPIFSEDATKSAETIQSKFFRKLDVLLWKAVTRTMQRRQAGVVHKTRRGIRSVGRATRDFYDLLTDAILWGGIKLPALHRISEPGEFFQRVAKVYAHSKLELKGVVFIIDELKSEKAAKFCAQMCFTIHDEATHWKDKPLVVGVMILTTPDWDEWMVKHSGDIPARRARRDTFNLFNLNETTVFVAANCRDAGWTFDPQFPSLLQHMSGGIPSLLQQLGQATCSYVIHRDPASRHVSDADLGESLSAEVTRDTIKQATENTLVYFNFLFTDILANPLGKSVLSGLCHDVDANWPITVKKSPNAPPPLKTAVEWRNLVSSRINSGTEKERKAAFKAVWEKLLSLGILRSIDENGETKYEFVAEAIRWYLNQLTISPA